MSNNIKKTLFLVGLLTSFNSYAKIHEFETTELRSMAGTGVAGILAEEAAFLNPASLAFFNTVSAFVQRDVNQIKNSRGDIIQKPKSTAIVLTDGNPNLSGSISYVNQEEGAFKRTRWGFSGSSPLSKQSAFGVSFRKTKDENILNRSEINYYQTVFGVTHALDEKTSLGLVAYDAFNSKGDATKAFVGFQHILLDYVTIAADMGGDYKSDEISKTILYRGALQIRALDDFYVRFGAFNDKSREEKGTGMGLAWIQPRLAFGFALKNFKQASNVLIGRNETKTREMSFSVSMRF